MTSFTLHVLLLVCKIFLLDAQRIGGVPRVEDLNLITQLELRDVKNISRPQTMFTDPVNTLRVLEGFGNTTVSVDCKTAFTEMLNALLTNTSMWVVKMIDATGKVGSGITEGNLIWTGSYSACMSATPEFDNHTRIRESPVTFRPQFCWSQFNIAVGGNVVPNLGVPTTGGGALIIGLCVPDVCSPTDLIEILVHLNNISHSVNRFINFTDVSCVPLNHDIGADYKAVICLVFCGLVITLISTATLYDLYIRCIATPRETKSVDEIKNGDDASEIVPNSVCINDDVKILTIERPAKSHSVWSEVLLCFSFYTNAAKLFNLNLSPDVLTCVNGIRVLSMAWIIYGHTYMIEAFTTDNKLLAVEWVNDFSFLLISQGELAVDTFFVLSGLLVTYLYLKQCDRNEGKISWLQFYLHRYWRLTPVYVAVLFLFEDILSKYYSNGPFWSQAGLNGDNCKKTWWWNLLYINNFVKNTEMCMGHTWYLANDMQFYIISPLILIFLKRHLRIAGVISGTLILISWICTGTIATVYKLTTTTVLGQTANYFDYMYDKPYCRIGPYIIGMICGYLLHHFNGKAKMNKIVVTSGWLIAFGLSSSITVGLYHANISPDVLALYDALSRSGWAIAVCWMIFACCNGYGGFINDFLSWPIWQPLGRLTYSSYLIHLVIIRVYFTSLNYPSHFSHLYVLFIFFGCFITSYFAAVFISLSFESPLLAVEKIFVRRK